MKYLKNISFGGALLALIAAFTFSASQAQNKQTKKRLHNNPKWEMLLGKVINAHTGQAVADAEVTVMAGGNKNNGMSEDTTVRTDADGLFMVKSVDKGNHVIRIQRDGYEQWKNTVFVPSLRKKKPQRPFNGFFRPKSDHHGWLHGVFHTNNNNSHPTNLYAKGLFIIIGMQQKQ